VAAASIVLDVFALSETKRLGTYVVLFKIIALSLTIYAGIYYQFPGIYGVDPWWHNQWIQETVNLGHITGGEFISNDYFLFPVFHLSSAITQIVTELSTHTAIFVSTGAMIALSSLFVFLIGERLANTKVGLLAALILALGDTIIERSTAIIPMSLAFCFYLAILYLVLGRDRKRVSDTLLVVLLSVTLILTHTVATLVMLFCLIAVFIGIKFYKKTSKTLVSYESVSLTLITCFGLAMLARWMQTGYLGATPFFDWNLKNFIDSLQHEAGFILTGPAIIKNVPYAVSILGQGGYLLLVIFAVIGALIYLHPKNRTGPRTALALITAVFLAVPYSFVLFSLRNILPERWFIFLYVPLSVLAVSGLSHMSSLIKGNIRKLGVIMLVILAGIFMMTTNTVANGDSPQVFNGASRIGYTQSELTAINTLSDIGVGRPIADEYYVLTFPYVAGYDKYMDMMRGDSRVFIQRNYYLQHAEWNQYYTGSILEGGFWERASEPMLISDYMKEQGIDRWPIIYRNNNVTVYSNAGVLP
jgi:hypothetical protein